MSRELNCIFNLGISYGATIGDISNIAELKNWNAEILEIPLSNKCNTIISEAKKFGYSFSIHVPSFELINKYEFIKNFKNEEEVLIYTKEIRKLLLSINEKAEYLVAHYPIRILSNDINLIESLNYVFITQIHKIAKEFGITLFIENVVTNSLYYLPKIFKNVLNFCDGLCFDIGHFHTAEAVLFNCNSCNSKKDYVAEFFNLYKDDIKCIHLYNCTNRIDTKFVLNRHYPYIQKSLDQGFMNVDNINSKILQLKNIKYVIHEIHRSEFDLNKEYDFNIFGKYQSKGCNIENCIDYGK